MLKSMKSLQKSAIASIAFLILTSALLLSCKTTAPKEDYLADLPLLNVNQEYIILEPLTIYTTNAFGKLTLTQANSVLYTRNRKAGLKSPYLSQYYACLFTPDTITALETAYKKYLSDFENKKLIRKSTRTKHAYGTFHADLHWGTFQDIMENEGTGKIYFGYTFIENSPYFTISASPLHNKEYDRIGSTVPQDSLPYDVYFTKNQMEQFIKALTSENLRSYWQSF